MIDHVSIAVSDLSRSTRFYEAVLGVLSLILWALILVVTCKYVLILLRADNKGEGGSFALLSLISRNLGHKKWAPTLVMLHEGLGCVGLWGDFPDKLQAATGAFRSTSE